VAQKARRGAEEKLERKPRSRGLRRRRRRRRRRECCSISNNSETRC